MRHPLHTLGRLLVGLALGSTAAFAQSPNFDVQFKVRGGSVFKSTTKEGAGHLSYGLGAEFAYKLNKDQAVFAEATATYYTAEEYRMAMPATGYVIGTGAQGALDGRYNADRRKDNLDGLGLRFGYRAGLANGFEWQAGLSLDRLKSKQEVIGLLSAGATNGSPAVYESLAFVVSSQKIVPGVFAGVRYQFMDGVHMEANLVNVGFSRANYMPYTYTGKPAVTETKNERKTSLEFALAMRF